MIWVVNEKQLNAILKKNPGVSFASGFKPAFKPSFGKGADANKDRSSGETRDLECDSGDGQVGETKLQIRYAGKAIVRIKFYRHRLADYSRAISEKAVLDAIVYAGCIRGDSETELLLIDEGQEKVATKEEQRTEITIEYPEVDYDNLWEEVPYFKTKGKK